jgi:hypothetical protein
MIRDAFTARVAEANLAPSVHNTQPTRWRLDSEGRVLVLEDSRRRLAIGDAAGRDAGVSHGAAIEGFALACAARGQTLSVERFEGPSDHGFRPVARLTLLSGAPSDPLEKEVGQRRTYRGDFAPLTDTAFLNPLTADGDVILVSAPQQIADIARLNDAASLKTFRNTAYRAELLSWMRLSRRHPNWMLDGLNAEAMEMSPVEAAGAGLVLKPRLFELCDALGLAPLFVAEASVVRSAAAIVLFHRPQAEHPIDTGRRFYRLWLEFTALGVAAAPMAVLADDDEVQAGLKARYGIGDDRRLITAFRLGRRPKPAMGAKPRLPLRQLTI